MGFCLLGACNKPEAGKQAVVSSPAIHDHSRKPKTGEAPYYHGLIEEYRTILAEDPNNLAALIALGNAYYDTGQWKRAITMYEHAIALDERNADVHTDMGTAYKNLGMADRALEEYRLALRYDPGHLDARYNMGIVYAHVKKDNRAAIRIWNELLKLAPNFPQADSIRSRIAALHGGMGKERQ